jgi:hypothetical protein
VAGVTAIETKVAGDTVNDVEPWMLPKVAVMVVVPAATGVAMPPVPMALLTVATVGVDDDQVTAPDRFDLLPSLYTPVAENCVVMPSATVLSGGPTEIDMSVTAETGDPELVTRLDSPQPVRAANINRRMGVIRRVIRDTCVSRKLRHLPGF